jgi:hypothetical protein
MEHPRSQLLVQGHPEQGTNMNPKESPGKENKSLSLGNSMQYPSNIVWGNSFSSLITKLCNKYNISSLQLKFHSNYDNRMGKFYVNIVSIKHYENKNSYPLNGWTGRQKADS